MPATNSRSMTPKRRRLGNSSLMSVLKIALSGVGVSSPSGGSPTDRGPGSIAPGSGIGTAAVVPQTVAFVREVVQRGQNVRRSS